MAAELLSASLDIAILLEDKWGWRTFKSCMYMKSILTLLRLIILRVDFMGDTGRDWKKEANTT